MATYLIPDIFFFRILFSLFKYHIYFFYFFMKKVAFLCAPHYCYYVFFISYGNTFKILQTEKVSPSKFVLVQWIVLIDPVCVLVLFKFSFKHVF